MQSIPFTLSLCLLLLFVTASGCSRSAAQRENLTPETEAALRSAQSILESCARTGKRGKELENGQPIIDALRPTHRDRADILEKGFEELRTIPENEIKATARRIMAQAQFECDAI